MIVVSALSVAIVVAGAGGGANKFVMMVAVGVVMCYSGFVRNGARHGDPCTVRCSNGVSVVCRKPETDVRLHTAHCTAQLHNCTLHAPEAAEK